MVRKSLFVLLAVLTIAGMAAGDVANAGLVNDDLQARVKGWQAGNWEIGLGDSVGGASFVSTTGPDPFVGTNTYNFTINYHASTGLANFQVSGSGFTSTLLTTPNYGITGYGFNGITLGLRATNGPMHAPNTLTLSNLNLNSAPLSGSYVGTNTYTTYTLYTGSLLTDIVLTGNFVFTGDYLNLNEDTKFDVNLVRAAPVPIPAAVWLLGSGLLGLVGLRRRMKK